MTMRAQLLFGVSLLVATATSFAGGATGQLNVQVTLNGTSSGNNNICTSASGSTVGNTSVQVKCTSNVYVNIVKLTPSKDPTDEVAGWFVTGFGLARTIAAMSERNRGLFDDAVALEDQGWSFEGQIFAENATFEQAKQIASRRIRSSEGILTALNLVGDDSQAGMVEMLVSF